MGALSDNLSTLSSGHNGQIDVPRLWQDTRRHYGQNVRMGGLSDFQRQFIERTKQLRERRGWSQQEMADALQISLSRYSKYEQRSPLPHEFIDLFTRLVGCDIDFYITGKIARRKHRPKQQTG